MSGIMSISEDVLEDSKNRKSFTVSIIECGRVGVSHAYLFAEAGFKVIGVNTNPHMLKLLKRGRTPFFKKVSQKLRRHRKVGNFVTSSDVREAAAAGDIVIIASQVAIDRKKKADYGVIEKTCKEVGLGLRKGAILIFVSATGPGVVEDYLCEVLEKSSGLKAGVDFGVASSPLSINMKTKTSGISESFRVVGAIDRTSLKVASSVLSTLTKAAVIEVSNIRTVEAVNLFQTLHKETSTALANELAFLCEALKIDFLEVLKVFNPEGTRNLSSPGIVTSSARKNFYLLQEEIENVNQQFHLTGLARKMNDEIVEHTYALVKDALKACHKTIRRSKLSILGVSRRPNTKAPPGDLTRNVINFLKKKVRSVQIYDPYFSKTELADLGFEADKLSNVAEKTDCVVILVGHSKFKRLSLKRIKILAKKSPALVDIGLVINPRKVEKYGFVYRGLGRGVWTK